jgi:23S rRNA (cytosine1962-C5)-methyltransferase
MGVSDKFTARKGDAFDTMAALLAEGERFDVVICDPPAFAPSKPALEKGLRAYERIAKMAAALVDDGGYLGLCSCSHAADLEKFRNSCNRGIGRATRSAQLIHTGFAGADHPLMPQLAESGYLKGLFYRMMP